MTLKTVVAFVKEVQKGATISYGRTFTADRKMKIATVPIGYADGFIRQNARDGYMMVNGKKAKIVGRICMDQTMLDVTDIEDVKTGDEVVVFGTGENGEPTADSLAENGRLVYSTCTVNDKENQAQVEKFLSANPDFHVVLPKTALPGADITPLGTLFLPHRTGRDGFFAAILERN